MTLMAEGGAKLRLWACWGGVRDGGDRRQAGRGTRRAVRAATEVQRTLLHAAGVRRCHERPNISLMAPLR